MPSVPDMKPGRCLGPEGNGVSSGERGEGGLGPPRGREDKQSTPTRKGATWRRKKKEAWVRRDEEGPACTE
jgi:hypothetical protein